MFENVQKWKENKEPQAWAKIPDWIRQYLIKERGHKCESCNNETHNNQEIPLDITYRDNDSYNTKEENLMLICPNCKSQRKH